MSKQTAVEWLEETLTMLWGHDFYRFEFEQAKKMEKEQIVKAWERRAMDLTGDDYYKVYYGGNDE